jgi:hypothetical protein
MKGAPVKRLLAGIAGVLGLKWVLRKRREAVVQDLAAERAEAEAAEPTADPRADELRERIEQAKATADDREEFEAGETPVDTSDPSARRATVHEDARARIDEMSARPEADAER